MWPWSDDHHLLFSVHIRLQWGRSSLHKNWTRWPYKFGKNLQDPSSHGPHLTVSSALPHEKPTINHSHPFRISQVSAHGCHFAPLPTALLGFRSSPNVPRQRVVAAAQTDKVELDSEYEFEVDGYHPVQPLVHDHGISFVCLSSHHTKIDQHVMQVQEGSTSKTNLRQLFIVL